MIKTENLENDLVLTYSDAGVKIHGGYPETDYDAAIDPVSAHRQYTETDIPVDIETEGEEATVEDYLAALGHLGVISNA